jgi:hypothetical protein
VHVAAAAASDWVIQGRVLTAPDGLPLPYDAIGPVISADGSRGCRAVGVSRWC